MTAIELHNAVLSLDDPDLIGDFSNYWFEAVQKAALKYRSLVAKHPGIGVDESGRIVPPEEGERLYPQS